MVACAIGEARAEVIYDQPYLGDRAARLPTKPLTADVASADQIFIGRATHVIERPAEIRATVEALDVLKGNRPAGKLDLKWVATATDIENGARFVLFLRGGAVIRTMYIHAPPSNHVRAFAALDGGLLATLGTLRALIDPGAARTGLSDMLRTDAASGETHRVQTAARLAIELDAPESIAALTEIVARSGDVYDAAAYTLVRLDRKNGARIVLDRLSNSPSLARLPETQAFAALAALGDAETVPVIGEFATKHVEFRVSAAFALARIGGAAAKQQIEAWLRDPGSSVKEHISNGSTSRDTPRAELYRGALATLRP
jgi:hypothetical protein